LVNSRNHIKYCQNEAKMGQLYKASLLSRSSQKSLWIYRLMPNDSIKALMDPNLKFVIAILSVKIIENIKILK
jgi:hypothetical protein